MARFKLVTAQLRYLPYIAFLLLVMQFAAIPAPLLAQEVPITYENYNTEMWLREDGSLHVRLTQQIRFDDTFSSAYYEIPIRNVSSIGNVQLYGAATNEANYEYDTVDLVPIAPNLVVNNGDSVLIEWNFPTTSRGDMRLFVIEYDAYGVVWIYPDHDFVRWNAVNEDRAGVIVQNSLVNLTLPEVIAIDSVTSTANLADVTVTTMGHTISYRANEPIPDGIPFEVTANFPHGLLDVGMQSWQREVDGENVRANIDSFNVSMNINADGTLDLHEITSASILEGALNQGNRSLPLMYIDQVSDPQVTVGGQPLIPGEGECSDCFVVNMIPRSENWVYVDPETAQPTINEYSGGEYDIDWYAALPIVAGQAVTTGIEYKVTGALRIDDQDQLLTWQVVPDFEQPVQSASLRLMLPPGVSADDVLMLGPTEQGSPQLQPDGALLYQFDGAVGSGAWKIALTLPAQATSAEVPLWHQQFEEVSAQADQAAVVRARNELILRVAGVLAIAAALLALVFAWYRWGRKKLRETLKGYVSEPPSKQSPAVVSYLVDRKVDEKGILGSIFYLASLRLLEIELEGEVKLRRIYDDPIHGTPTLTDISGEPVHVARHLQILFDKALIPVLPLNQWVSIDAIGASLQAALPDIYAALATDVQRLYIHIPGSSSDSIPGSLWFVVYATLLALLYFEIIKWYVAFAIGFVVLTAFVAWGALRGAGQGGYTDEAALEADRWRRFRTYLLEIKKFGDLGAAQEILDRYFGYAVALGVERVVLAQASDLGTLPPIWMANTSGRIDSATTQRRSYPGQSGNSFPWFRRRPQSSQSVPQPTAEANPSAAATLSSISERLGDTISQASTNMGALLTTAAGDTNNISRTVVVNSLSRRREFEWKPNTPVKSVLDDILRQSVSDARQIQAREVARRESQRSPGGTSGGWDWGSGGGSSSSSRSSSSFGSTSRSSSSSSRSSSSSSSRSSSSSSSRSGGGGRSGFR